MRRLIALIVVALSCAIGVAQDVGSAQTVRVGVLKDGAYEVVTLPIETYVARVLAGEALPGSDAAAQEALAIAIRTYTAGNRNKHRAEGFDLCDQTHCQVMRTATPVTESAAAATRGQVLLYRGAPAQVYYSASCGGHTERPSNVWPGSADVPYLPSRPDDGCGGMPEWSAELTLADLQEALEGAGFRGTLRDARVGGRTESKRVGTLVLEGMAPDRISGQDLRAALGRTIGWQYVRSTVFDLQRTDRGFRFRGHGYGHGVGMCVIGSTKLAAAGETARQILTRYFPGTTIGQAVAPATAIETDALRLAPAEEPVAAPIPSTPVASAPAPVPGPPLPASASAGVPRISRGGPPDVAIALPENDEPERAGLADFVSRERAALAGAIGVAPGSSVVMHVHPTSSAYETVTGQPWFTLGSVVDGELHVVPLSTLRSGGVLERTIKHQLVHLLVDGALMNRPTWVREGAALHFSDGGNGPGHRGACPYDAEFKRPVSAGALGDVYARARACFEKQLSLGRKWQDVR